MEALASLIMMNFVFKDLPHTVPIEFCLGHKGWLFSRIPVTFFDDFADQDMVQSVVSGLSDRSHEGRWARDGALIIVLLFFQHTGRSLGSAQEESS